ncbi:MAG: hypothetical protein R6U96_04180 [Promethearchaeia archaeon]
MVRETRLANFAKMANMLIDLFGLEKSFKKYVKEEQEGEQIEMQFPALTGSLKFVLTREIENFEVRVEKAENPAAVIIINVEDKYKATDIVSKIIRSKSNIFGLLKIVPKILTGKIKIKGSFLSALTLCRLMMIGKNKIYKEKPNK